MVRNEIKGLRVVLDLRVEAGEIEAVKDKVFLDLAKVLVALARQEPRDPLVQPDQPFYS